MTDVLAEAFDRGERNGRQEGENYMARTHPGDRTIADLPDPPFEAVSDLIEEINYRDPAADDVVDMIIEAYQSAYLAGWRNAADLEEVG